MITWTTGWVGIEGFGCLAYAQVKLDHHEKELVRLAMEKAEGNVTRAASYLV